MTAAPTVPYLTGIVAQLPGYGTEFPHLDVLNMPDPIRPVWYDAAKVQDGASLEDAAHWPTVALTAVWDDAHAAHIEAVTGRHLWQPTGGWISSGRLSRDGVTRYQLQDFREGAVVAHATITGCHRVEADEFSACCTSLWATDGLWHWTCEVTPTEVTR